jgi:hypothetical protein
MVRKEKKSFAKSKKFAELQVDRKTKLQERNIQKKTGYERDIRTLSKRVLAPLRAAEQGELEVTREDLVKIKQNVDKLIIRARALEVGKGVNLSRSRMQLDAERHLIVDYIHGKINLPGFVKKKGEKSLPQTGDQNNGKEQQTENIENSADRDFNQFGFSSVKTSGGTTQSEYFKNLGFNTDEGHQEAGKDEDVIVTPIAKPQTEGIMRANTPGIQKAPENVPMSPGTRKMVITMIDDTISTVINTGIEHLMFYRRDKKPSDLSYRDEILRYIEIQIVQEKKKVVTRLKEQGQSDNFISEFSILLDREFLMSRNEMIRKCLYMSRVLEYRKGSTSSG